MRLRKVLYDSSDSAVGLKPAPILEKLAVIKKKGGPGSGCRKCTRNGRTHGCCGGGGGGSGSCGRHSGDGIGVGEPDD